MLQTKTQDIIVRWLNFPLRIVAVRTKVCFGQVKFATLPCSQLIVSSCSPPNPVLLRVPNADLNARLTAAKNLKRLHSVVQIVTPEK